MINIKKIFIIGLLIIVIVISGCYAQKTPVQPTAAPSTGDLEIKTDIEISGFAFNPSTLTISKGASVVWTNKDSAPHTIVSDTGWEINSDTISKGNTYVHIFNTPGTYEYHCGIHPSMKGKVVVE